jgi:hypothetical protein
MEPRTPAARARWLRRTLRGLAGEVRALRAELGALTAAPPAPTAAERALGADLLAELEALERECARLTALLGRFQPPVESESDPE